MLQIDILRRPVAIVLFAVGFLAVGACGKKGDSVSGEPVDMSDVEQIDLTKIETVGENGLDISFASDLFHVGVVIHPQRLVASGLFTFEDIEALLGEWATGSSMPLRDCRQALLLMSADSFGSNDPSQNAEALPLLVLEFSEPFEFAPDLSKQGISLDTTSLYGPTIYFEKQSSLAAFQMSDGRVVIGHYELLSQFAFGRMPHTGEFGKRLGQVDLDADVSGVFYGESLEMLFPTGNGESVQERQMFFTISLSDEIMASLDLEAADERQAKEFKRLAEESLTMLSTIGPLAIRAAAGDLSQGERAELTRFITRLRSGVDIQVEESRVLATVTRPANLESVLQIAGDIMRKEQQVLQRAGRFETVAKAMYAHHETHKLYPPIGDLDSEDPGRGLSWRVHLLPFLGEQDLYDAFRLDEPWDSEHNIALLDRMPDAFLTADSTTDTTICVMSGGDAPFHVDRATDHATIADGRTKTLMIIDRGSENALPWTKPDQWQYDPSAAPPEFGNADESFFLAALFDQTVRRIPKTITESNLRALITATGEEQFDLNEALGIPSFDREGGPPGFRF